ncbi:hypothetical protein J4E80_009122 [Alternaria sp. BMP 0032]|nr:hypothetical protein J4E80_009122 [Alternaria sp. BMP 0032]
MATDFRHTSRYLPRVPKQVGVKRGLRSDLPLEAKISDYYGPNPDNNRWLRRHAVFNHLYRRKETVGGASDDDCKQARRISEDLRDTFADLATKITPSKPRRKGKDKARVRKPDFDKQDETHANLLGTMRSELQENEVHSNFDFLSFYRRAFGLVLRLREEVLMSDDVRRSRAEDINANFEPHNFQLITDLFRDLRIEPKTKKEEEAEAKEGAGQQLSAKVVPLKQIRRVAEMMHDLTLAKGDVELRRAKLRVKGDWEGLKASYAAEEAEKEASGVEESVPQAESEDEVVTEVSDALDGLAPPLSIVNGTKRTFEADRDSEDGGTYTLGSQILGQKHTQCATKNWSDEPDSLEVLDVAIDTQDMEALSRFEDKRNDIRRKYEAGVDSTNRPVHLLNSGGWNGACVEVAADEHIPTSIAPEADQRHSLGAQIRQVMGTAAAISLAAPINDDNKHSGTRSIGCVSLATATRNKPKGIYHRITYSSTTSRKSRITAIFPSSSSKNIKLLALTQPRKASFQRLSGTARKHRIAFHCYTRCAMARALHGQQTRLQRRMAIAVAELKKKARRDSAGKF